MKRGFFEGGADGTVSAEPVLVVQSMGGSVEPLYQIYPKNPLKPRCQGNRRDGLWAAADGTDDESSCRRSPAICTTGRPRMSDAG